MSQFNYYIHDHSDALRLSIIGDLSGPGVASLDQAWRTANSVLYGRELVIDLAATCADECGRNLILCWHRMGARIIARSSESRALAEGILGVPIPILAANPGWRQRLRELLIPRSAAAANAPAQAMKTSTGLFGAEEKSAHARPKSDLIVDSRNRDAGNAEIAEMELG